MTEVFTLSVELFSGQIIRPGAHLGTDRDVAERFAEEYFAHRMYHARGVPLQKARTVALYFGGKYVDCFDGEWGYARDAAA